MIHQPPIDKLVEITGCKYALACIVSKRARQIMDQPLIYDSATGLKAITQAAEEIMQGRLTYIKD